MSERYLIAAGGTGGHVFPAQATAYALKDQGCYPIILTDERGKRYLKDDIEHYVISAQSVSGGVVQKIKAALSIVKGTWQSFSIIRRSKPGAVASFGGYASFPTGIAAVLASVPLILHEQNAVFGKSNRMLASFASRIALSFAQTRSLKEALKPKCLLTGNPVRPGFLSGMENEAKKTDEDKITILILGGSQGARILSSALPKAILSLPVELVRRLKLIQQCRPEDLPLVQSLYEENKIDARLAPFFSDVSSLMAQADLMITRSGASTLSEILSLKKPAFLVPYPHAAENHQFYNAKALDDAGAARLLDLEKASTQEIASALQAVLEDEQIRMTMADNLDTLAFPNAAGALAELMIRPFSQPASHVNGEMP